MHQENGMPFKSFVSTLMELLEDADGMVRDTARNSVIALFQYVGYQPLLFHLLILATEMPPMLPNQT
jgi:hypothetical protein